MKDTYKNTVSSSNQKGGITAANVNVENSDFSFSTLKKESLFSKILKTLLNIKTFFKS